MNDSPMEQLIKSLTKKDDTKVVHKEWHDDKLEKITEDEAMLLLEG